MKKKCILVYIYAKIKTILAMYFKISIPVSFYPFLSIPVPFLWIPVLFLWIPVLFLWILVHSCGFQWNEPIPAGIHGALKSTAGGRRAFRCVFPLGSGRVGDETISSTVGSYECRSRRGRLGRRVRIPEPGYVIGCSSAPSRPLP